LYLMTSQGLAGPAIYFFAKFVAIVAGIALYSIFWNFTDGYFDIQDGKRLFGLFSAGAAAGAIAGGVLVGAVSAAGYVEPLFLVWSGRALATLPLVVVIGRRHEQLEEEEDPYSGGIVEKRERRLGSYLPLFAASVMVTLVLAAVAEY